MKYEIELKDSRGTSLEVVQQLPSKGDNFPTILLVPGFGVDLHEYGLYDDIAAHLVKHKFNVVSFSFAGTGRSAGNFVNTTMEYQVQQLRDVIAYVLKDRFTNKEQFGLLGHAFGASVVIAALPIPEVKTFIFTNPIAHPIERISTLYRRQRALKIDGVSKLERPNRDMTKIGPQFWQSLKHFNLVGLIRKIEQPTLFIHGTKDRKVKQDDVAHYYNSMIAKKQIHIVEKADHAFTGNFRPAFLDLVSKWCEEYVAS